MTPFPFLDLPREIRDKIYNEVTKLRLLQPVLHPASSVGKEDSNVTAYRRQPTYSAELTIFRTNRQVYEEASHLFFLRDFYIRVFLCYPEDSTRYGPVFHLPIKAFNSKADSATRSNRKGRTIDVEVHLLDDPTLQKVLMIPATELDTLIFWMWRVTYWGHEFMMKNIALVGFGDGIDFQNAKTRELLLDNWRCFHGIPSLQIVMTESCEKTLNPSYLPDPQEEQGPQPFDPCDWLRLLSWTCQMGNGEGLVTVADHKDRLQYTGQALGVILTYVRMLGFWNERLDNPNEYAKWLRKRDLLPMFKSRFAKDPAEIEHKPESFSKTILRLFYDTSLAYCYHVTEIDRLDRPSCRQSWIKEAWDTVKDAIYVSLAVPQYAFQHYDFPPVNRLEWYTNEDIARAFEHRAALATVRGYHEYAEKDSQRAVKLRATDRETEGTEQEIFDQLWSVIDSVGQQQ
ncbi:MAG: hypothetical protein M1820_000705 [Bogoriella megaspora]|nr:MAG: hypothetical protein M1820_000705 [Bogoriella megaspora]